jgi:hypothetical protein
MLDRQLLEQATDGWDDEHIWARTEQLIDVITEIWPVPEGHQSRTERIERRPTREVELADLMAAGLLEEGATLYARRRGLNRPLTVCELVLKSQVDAVPAGLIGGFLARTGLHLISM